MATWINWSVIQNNKCVLSGQVTDEDGNPVDLTDFDLQLVIKPAENSADDTGTTYMPDVTNPARGEWSLTIPGSDFSVPATAWYRLDVVDFAGDVVTANVGTQTVTAA